MSGVATAIVAAAVIGYVASDDASRKASHSASDALAAQQAQQAQNLANNQPWKQSGANALDAINNGFGLPATSGNAKLDANGSPILDANGKLVLATNTTGGSVGGVGFGQFNHQFDAADLKNGLAPNYDFQLSQGLGAVNNQNSVTGGLVGGNALKGISDYTQNSAAGAYQQAFNNYNTNQTNIYNRLANIAGLGQTSNGQTSSLNTQLAGNAGSANLAGGAAAASGSIGMGNAISNGLVNGSMWSNFNSQPMTSNQVPTTYSATAGSNAYPVSGGTTNDAAFYQ